MAIRYIQNPVPWKSFTDDSIDTYTGLDRQPVLDKRNGKIRMRVMDGVTPGGTLIGGSVVASVDRPTVQTPANGATGIVLSPVITGSAFVGSVDETPDTHASTDWQISTVNTFASVVHESLLDSTNKTSYDLDAASVVLNAETQYFIRIRYHGNSGEISEWSPIVSFTTGGVVADTTPTKINGPVSASINMGHRMVISNDGLVMAVAAPGESVGGNGSSGVIYVYVKQGGVWAQVNRLTAEATAPFAGRYLGKSGLDISDDGGVIAAATAHQYVHVFVSGGDWSTASIEPVTSGNDECRQGVQTSGSTIAVSGDGAYIAVGIPFNGDGGTARGLVKIYTFNGTALTQNALIGGLSSNDQAYCGNAVAIDQTGTRVVVGCPGDFNSVQNNGRIRILNRSGTAWTLDTAFAPASGTGQEDKFGGSVQISNDGTVIAVGHHSTTVKDVIVYRYNGSAWAQEAALTPASGNASYRNASVALSGDGNHLFVGGYSHSTANTDDWGDVDLFSYNGSGWDEVAAYDPASLNDGDFYGFNVATDGVGANLVVGAYNDASVTAGGGAIYVFD